MHTLTGAPAVLMFPMSGTGFKPRFSAAPPFPHVRINLRTLVTTGKYIPQSGQEAVHISCTCQFGRFEWNCTEDVGVLTSWGGLGTIQRLRQLLLALNGLRDGGVVNSGDWWRDVAQALGGLLQNGEEPSLSRFTQGS
jgi:hypothetical protein